MNSLQSSPCQNAKSYCSPKIQCRQVLKSSFHCSSSSSSSSNTSFSKAAPTFHIHSSPKTSAFHPPPRTPLPSPLPLKTSSRIVIALSKLLIHLQLRSSSNSNSILQSPFLLTNDK